MTVHKKFQKLHHGHMRTCRDNAEDDCILDESCYEKFRACDHFIGFVVIIRDTKISELDTFSLHQYH